MTAMRARTTFYTPSVGYPSDHRAIGMQYDIYEDLGVFHNGSTRKKPLGWWPAHPEQFQRAVVNVMDHTTPSIAATSAAIHSLAL